MEKVSLCISEVSSSIVGERSSDYLVVAWTAYPECSGKVDEWLETCSHSFFFSLNFLLKYLQKKCTNLNVQLNEF